MLRNDDMIEYFKLFLLHKNDLILHDRLIYILDDCNIKLEILNSCHDFKILEYLKQIKILKIISWNYFWLYIYQYINEYIQIYDIYIQNKISWHFSYNQLYSLLISIESWKFIFMNYIIKLSQFNNHDIIYIYINKFIKIIYFYLMTSNIIMK